MKRLRTEVRQLREEVKQKEMKEGALTALMSTEGERVEVKNKRRKCVAAHEKMCRQKCVSV